MSDPDQSTTPANGGSNGDNSGDENARRSNGDGWLSSLLRGRSKQRNGDNGWRESIEEVLEEHDDGEQVALGDEERRMLANIVSLGGTRVDDVMVPRGDIIALDINQTLSEIVSRYLAAPHSRLLVYRDQLDEVVGVLHIKDLVKFWGRTGEIDLQSILRPPLVVPPSKSVIDLLVEMRAGRRHLAIVVDEYGGVDGLVTIEDLIEEVIGDIRDEHDDAEDPRFIQKADGTIEVDARFELADFEERVGCDLLADEEDEEIDTLGGFVFVALGRVPKRGEVIRHDCGLEFEIVDADPRRIHRLRVRRSNDGQQMDVPPPPHPSAL